MSSTSGSFTITANSSTDIWRKPPTTDVFNAPTKLIAKVPLTSFSRARLTFSNDWKYRYDQGGLLLHLTKHGEKDRWLKTGIEFYNDTPFVSTVGCDKYADWSIHPTAGDEESHTVEARREGDENGKGLWVYWVKNGERNPLREVAWFFADEEGWEVSVSAMACRPAKEDVTNGERLEVTFWDIVMEEVK